MGELDKAAEWMRQADTPGWRVVLTAQMYADLQHAFDTLPEAEAMAVYRTMVTNAPRYWNKGYPRPEADDNG